MDTLPYDDILQAVAEMQIELDRSEEIQSSMLNRLFAPMERLQDIQTTRAKRADEYQGAHRRAAEQNKGTIDTTLPKVEYEAYD